MDLINTKQAAALLGVSVGHLRDRLAHRPEFPTAYRPAGRRLWDRDELLHWLRSTREKRAAQPSRAAMSAASGA